jgi:tetratricopeptide (TPR) repeat protein
MSVLLLGLYVLGVLSWSPQEKVAKALEFHQQGKLAQAEELYKQLVQEVPHVAGVRYNLAVILENQFKFKEAFELLEESMELFPEESSLANAGCTIVCVLAQDMVSEVPDMIGVDQLKIYAHTFCFAPLLKFVQNLEFVNKVALAYTLFNAFEKGALVYETLLKAYEDRGESRSPQATIAKTNLANLYSRAGSYENSISLIRDALEDKNNLELCYSLLSTVISTCKRGPEQAEAIELSLKSLDEFVKVLPTSDRACRDKESSWTAITSWESLDPKNVTVLNPETAWIRLYSSYPNYVYSTTEFIGPELKHYPLNFVEKKVFLVQLSNVYLNGKSGIMHHDCKLYTSGHAGANRIKEVHNEKSLTALEKTVTSQHVVASLVQLNVGNHYHFLAEVFPRFLVLLKQVILPKPYVKILVSIHCVDRLKELITLLAHDTDSINDDISMDLLERIQVYDSLRGRWKFPQLFFADWEAPPIDKDPIGTLALDAWAVYYPPAFLLQEARTRFRNLLRAEYDMKREGQWTIVFVSRPTGIRSIPNEQDLVEALSRDFGEERVVVFHGQGSLLDQAKTFARAQIVIGAHGAGLTNMLFSEEHTSLLMFPMDPHVDHCNSNLVTLS